MSKALKHGVLKSSINNVKKVSYLQNKFNISQNNNIEIQIYNNFEDIKKYNEMGYQYFKLEGRTLTTGTVFANYLYYLVKPEYHFLFIEMACKENILFNNYNDSDIFTLVGKKESTKIIY